MGSAARCRHPPVELARDQNWQPHTAVLATWLDVVSERASRPCLPWAAGLVVVEHGDVARQRRRSGAASAGSIQPSRCVQRCPRLQPLAAAAGQLLVLGISVKSLLNRAVKPRSVRKTSWHLLAEGTTLRASLRRRACASLACCRSQPRACFFCPSRSSRQRALARFSFPGARWARKRTTGLMSAGSRARYALQWGGGGQFRHGNSYPLPLRVWPAGRELKRGAQMRGRPCACGGRAAADQADSTTGRPKR